MHNDRNRFQFRFKGSAKGRIYSYYMTCGSGDVGLQYSKHQNSSVFFRFVSPNFEIYPATL